MKSKNLLWKIAVLVVVWGAQPASNQAQAIHEVLCAIQERKLAVVQRDTTNAELIRSYETRYYPEPLTEEDPIEESELIDWGFSLPKFPNASDIAGLRFDQTLALLNRAVRELEGLKGSYIGLDSANPKQVHESSSTGLIRFSPLADFDESNWRILLRALASEVSAQSALAWPFEFTSLDSTSLYWNWEAGATFASDSDALGPFMVGNPEVNYSYMRSPGVQEFHPNPGGLYSGLAASGSAYRVSQQGEDGYHIYIGAGFTAINGLRSWVSPTEGNGSHVIQGGKLVFYKRMETNPVGSAMENVYFSNWPNLPIKYWQEVDEGTDVYSWGDFTADDEPQPSTYSDLHSLYDGILEKWSLPTIEISGEWQEHPEDPNRQVYTYEDGLDQQFAISMRCVCIPNFTPVLGTAQRHMREAGTPAPGRLDVTVDSHVFRLGLGAGLWDRNQSAYLSSSLDGFGNPIFVGNSGAFKVIYETNVNNFPACLVPERMGYDQENAELTEEQKNQTGWFSKKHYVGEWYKPKLRQIYGSDVVVDIVHTHDYYKVLNFYWAKDVPAPGGAVTTPQTITATPFKTVIVQNGTVEASPGFPTTNKKLRIIDAGIHWEIEKTGDYSTFGPETKYVVKQGTEVGASDLSTSEILMLTPSTVRETSTQSGVTTVTETQFIQLDTEENATSVYFGRFSNEPVPVKVKQGTREVQLTYTPYTGPDGQPLDWHRPVLASMSFSGDPSWEMNGAQYQWTLEGALSYEKRQIHGQLLEATHNWEGRTQTSSHKLGGTTYRTVTTEYSSDFLTTSVSVDGGPPTQYVYDAALGTLKQILQPSGHQTTITTTPGLDQTIVRIQEGFGAGHSSGTDTTITTNRWGGLISRVAKTTEGLILASETGSEHTGWGAPTQVEGLRGEEASVTFNTSGHAWGLPTNWTTPFGVAGSVSSYDTWLRPASVNTGFSNLNFNYSNLLQPSVSISGQGTVSASFTPFGELTQFNDTSAGGTSLNLNTGSLTVDGRQIDLELTNAREVLGRDSGLGSRGMSEAWSVEGEKLCRTTTLKTQSDGAAATIKTFYDGQGRVVKVQAPDANGQMRDETWVYDDAQRSVEYVPPSGGQSLPIKSVLSPDGLSETISEDGVERFKHVRSVVNGKLVFLYQVKDDSDGSGGNNWKTLSYSEVDPQSGTTVERAWDLAANVQTSTTTVPGQSTTITTTSGETGDTQTMYLTQGRPTAVSGTVGGVPFNLGTWTYESDHLSAISGTVGGKATGVGFDADGRINLSWGPGFDKEFEYGGAPGYTVTVTDNLQGTVQTVSASAVGDFTFLGGAGLQELSAATTDSAGGTTETTINGSVSVRQGPDGSVTRKTSNGLVENFGRKPDGSISSHGVGPEAATVNYGADGSITTGHGSDGDTVESRYKTGLREHITGPGGDNRATTWYNGRLKEEWHQGGIWNGAKVTRSHDAKGRSNGATVTGAGGYTFSHTHDAFGRPSLVSTSGGFYGSYAYDTTSGQLNTFVRGPLTTTLSRDAQGRVTGVSTVNSAGPDVSYGHGYNAKHLRTSRTASGAGSSWTGLTYNAAHGLTGAHVGSRVLSYGYDARGNRTLGGSAETWTVNGIDQVTGRTVGQRGYGVQGSVAPGARVKVYHPGAPHGEELPVNEQTGAYAASWLVDGSFAGGGVSSVEILVRGTLEGAGDNGRDAVADQKAWVMVPAALESFQYDGAGRLIGDSLWIYGWNARGHLTSMVRKAGTMPAGTVGESLVFTCDADGRRVRKLHTVSYETGTPLVEESKVLWDGWLPVMEERTVNGAALPKRWFVWGRDVSGGWDSAGGIGGLAGIQEEGGRILLPVEDGLGNITAVVNAGTGAVVATYDYGPYGEPLGQTGEAEACPFRYQSKYQDAETGHYYFGYRYYSPKLGRWLSRDPLGEAGGFNLYAYCANDPVNKHDMLGREPKLYWTDNIADTAFIGADGKPQVKYVDWAGDGMLSRGWNWAVGGNTRTDLRSPTCDELARLFRRDSDGSWRIATTREHQEESWRQLDPALRQSMRNTQDTLVALAKVEAMLLAGIPTVMVGGPAAYTYAQLMAGRGLMWYGSGGAATFGAKAALTTGGTIAAYQIVGGESVGTAISNGGAAAFDVWTMTGTGSTKLSMPRMPQIFRQPLWQTLGYSNSRAMQMGSVSLPTGARYVGPMPPRAYSVAFEHRLRPSEYGLNQERHFQLANEALKAERSASPWLAQAVPSPIKWGRPPEGWTWQHATIEQGRGAGLLQLVPRSQHSPGSPFWKLFHTLPGGAGGYWQWAVPAGAPPR